MKNVLSRRAAIAMIAAAALMPMTASAQDKVEASLGVDIESNYIWRGQKLGGVAIQPSLSFGYKGLSLGAWGSVGFDSSDTREFDLTLSYAPSSFSISLTDYWFSKAAGDVDAEYFHYGARSSRNSHVFEAQVGYDFKVLAVNWYTNIAGADGVTAKGKRAYSSYVTLSAPFKLGGLDWTAELGATPWETSFYDATGFAVTSVSVGATKDIEVTEKFHLPISAKATWNPRTEAAYFTAGISF
jgi:hypothetical protein